MHFNKKVLFIIPLIPVLHFALRVYWEGHQSVLEDRFPDVDPTIVRRIHKEIMKEALRGTLPGDPKTDEDYDAIFHEKLKNFTKI